MPEDKMPENENPDKVPEEKMTDNPYPNFISE